LYAIRAKNLNVSVAWYWDAFLLRPLLAWNHNQVMSAGERGLAVWLKDPAHAAVVLDKAE
jgi:hypothetical protein